MSALSVPIPTRFVDVDDHFIGVISGAPRFEFLQSVVTYTITLEMMFDSLRKGIESVAARSKSETAKDLYVKSLQDVEAAHRMYSSNNISEGQALLLRAHNNFRLAANKRLFWKQTP